MTTTTTQPTAREIERTYDVALGNVTIHNVRLRYEPGTEPADRIGDEARRQAIKRARRLADRRGINLAGIDPDDTGVTVKQESLVPARDITPRDLESLERKFRRPDAPKQASGKQAKRGKAGRNGWA